MESVDRILRLLALSRAASTSQLRAGVPVSRSAAYWHIGQLKSRGFIEVCARVSSGYRGHFEEVYRLSQRGAEEVGLGISRISSPDAVRLSLLRASYVLAHADRDYLRIFGDQVAALERSGQVWPWKSRAGKAARTGALVWRESGGFSLALPVAGAERADMLLEPLRLYRQLPFGLTVLCPESQAEEVQEAISGRWTNPDPFLSERLTVRQWRKVLETLRPKERRYRELIEQLIKESERRGGGREQAVSLRKEGQGPVDARVFSVPLGQVCPIELQPQKDSGQHLNLIRVG